MSVYFYFASVVVTAVLAGGLAAYAWRRRHVPAARIYAGLALCVCLLALTELFVMLSPMPAQALFWYKLGYPCAAAMAVLWLAFAVAYSGRQAWLSRRTLVVACIIPVITQVILWSNPLHGLWAKQEVAFLRDGPFWVAQTSARVPGLGFLVYSFYGLILVALGVALLLLTARRRRGADRGQAILLAAGALIVLATAVIPAFNLIPQARFNPFVPGIGVALLLYALAIFRFQFLRRARATTTSESAQTPEMAMQRSLAVFLLVYAIIAAGIASAGYLSFRNYEREYRAQVESQLSAIVELKVNALADWRQERLADAEILHRNPAFNRLAQRVLEQPDDVQARAELQAWLERYDSYDQYDRIFLLDASGIERISALAPAEPIPTFLTRELDVLSRAEQVTFLDFHRDAPDRPIHLSLLVPVRAAQDGRPLGILVLSIDPYRYLYPFIQRWPIPSASGETLLVRQEGTAVFYLNELRFQSNTALNLRLPLTSPSLPAAAAALGREGVIEGVDYRGAPVAAALHRVPDSPWFLVAKMDTAEVYAPLRARLWLTAAFFAALILALGAGLGALWRHQRATYYRRQAEAAQALRESEERYRLLAETTRDIILLHDMQGRITYMNEAGLQFTGLSAAEAAGQPVTAFVPPQRAAEIAERFARRAAGDTSSFRYETEFLNRAGQAVPVEVNSTPIVREGKPAAILIVARDITERKEAERKIRESEETYRNLFQNAQVGLFRTRIADGKILESNEQLARMFGYDSREEFIAEYVTSQNYVDPGTREQMLRRLQENGQVSNFQARFYRKDRSIFWAQYSARIYPEKGWIEGVAEDITARKEAEETLRALSARQEAILAAIPDIVMEVDRDRVYTWANQAGIAFFGEDVIGKEAAAYFVGAQDTYDAVQPLFDGSEDVIYVGSWQRRKDGEARLLAWWCKTIKDTQGNVTGVLSTARDITEQKAAEAEMRRLLAESETSRQVLLSVLEDHQRAETQREEALAQLAEERNLLRTLIDNLPDYIYVKDREGRFLLGNVAVARSFGKATPDEIFGKSDFDFHPPELAAQYRADEEEIIRSGQPLVNREEPVVEPDGTRKWLLTTKAPLRDSRGEVVGLVGIGRDITARKQAEEALRRLNEELEARVLERTAQLEAANRELESFAYSVSHDLRAPLRGIDGWSLVLQEDYGDRLDEQACGYLDRVRAEAQRMGQLIDDLLQLSRVTRAEMRREPVDLTALAQTIVARLRESHPTRAVTVTIQPGLQTRGDRRLLEIALTNLFDNAWKFTARNPAPQIEFGCLLPSSVPSPDGKGADSGGNGGQVFFIRDNGVGFDMAYADKLFGAFQRMHRMSEFPGTGVGLATVQRIIHRHGGRIWAEAEVNQGATFYFTLE